jgi:hypothetical protein
MTKKPRPKKTSLERKRTVALQAVGLCVVGLTLIERPQRFSRKAYALDTRGRSVQVDDPQAARFCLAGALLRAEHERYGTEIARRTAESTEKDDLLEPVLPDDAPLRLRVALTVLAHAAQARLGDLGTRYELVEPSEKTTRPTELHLPLLLGLHPKGGHRACQAALRTTALSLAALTHDDDLLDRVISDSALDRKGGR